ncbi:hypothetical protein TNCV_1455951 [Trichonephila clavipes]|nr:hypothetical protein TNCV_1455951 [Trichonephila clavipes]
MRSAGNRSPPLTAPLKTAVVIPILKPGKNSVLAESYRPISLLPVLSKLAEKVILARLNDHLERENILIPEQHGFNLVSPPPINFSESLNLLRKETTKMNARPRYNSSKASQKLPDRRLEADRPRRSSQFINDHHDHQDFGHSACYTKRPKFPQPKKGTAFTDPIKKKNFVSKWTKEGISFANVVSGEIPSQTPPENNNNKKEDTPREFLSQEDNILDLAQVLELFNIISKLVKKNPKILDLLSKFKNSNSDEEKTCLLAEAIMNNV